MAKATRTDVDTSAKPVAKEKFDQRQAVFGRAARGELGPEMQKRRVVESVDPLRRAIYISNKGTRAENALAWYMTQAVDGPVNPEKTEVTDLSVMTTRIKGLAQFFGADLVGVTELDPAFVYSHKGSPIDVKTGQYGEEINIPQKYAIAIAKEMDYEKIKASPSWIDTAEVGRVYVEVAKIAILLAGYIRELGYPAKAHHFRKDEVLHVPIAVMAGIGELGRNGYVITRDFGPRVRLSIVTTDLPMLTDKPVKLGAEEFCKICKKCAQNCKPKSIPMGEKTVVRGVEKWAIDPDRCLSYWVANPAKWDACSDCIKTCPWNKPNKWYHKAATKFVGRSHIARKLLLWMDDIIYGKNPHYRVKWLDMTND